MRCEGPLIHFNKALGTDWFDGNMLEGEEIEKASRSNFCFAKFRIYSDYLKMADSASYQKHIKLKYL